MQVVWTFLRVCARLCTYMPSTLQHAQLCFPRALPSHLGVCFTGEGHWWPGLLPASLLVPGLLYCLLGVRVIDPCQVILVFLVAATRSGDRFR